MERTIVSPAENTAALHHANAVVLSNSHRSDYGLIDDADRNRFGRMQMKAGAQLPVVVVAPRVQRTLSKTDGMRYTRCHLGALHERR